MVKSAEKRTRKYKESVDGERVGRAVSDLKDIMVEQQKTYFPKIAMLEDKVKALCEAQGVSTLQVRDYINIGRKCFSIARKFTQATRDAEAQRIITLWTNRGLDAALASQVCNLTGCKTTAAPTPPIISFIPLIYNLSIFSPPRSRYDHYWMASLLAGYMQNSIGLVQERLYVMPYPLTRRLVFDAIGVYIDKNGSVDARIRLGLYNSDNNNQPDQLLADSGELDASSTGTKETAVDLDLDEGLYWICGVTNESGIEIYYGDRGLCLIQGDEPFGGYVAFERRNYPLQPYPSSFPYDPANLLNGFNAFHAYSLRLKEIP